MLIQRQDSHSGRDEDKKFKAARGACPLASRNLEEGWYLWAVQRVHCYDGEHVLNAYVMAVVLLHPVSRLTGLPMIAEYAYFFFYSFVRGAYIKRRTPPGGKAPVLSTAAELLLGALAGALAQIFTIPVSVIATRQQVGSAKRTVKKKVVVPPVTGTAYEPVEKWIEEEEYVDNSFWGVGREIVREEGFTGLWLGIKPGLVLTVNPAITYGAFERVKSILLMAQEKAASVAAPSNGKMTPGMNFLVGALSKTLATVVTYPYIMAKVRIQARGCDAQMAKEDGLPAPPHHAYHHSANSKHPGALDLLRTVYMREGFAGWYQVSLPHRAFGNLPLTGDFCREWARRSSKRSYRRLFCSCPRISLNIGRWLSWPCFMQ